MGRPPSRSVNLKDGYYIELRRSGENKGMMLHRDTHEEILRATKNYESVYNVIYIGLVKKGKVVDLKKEKAKKAKAKKK